MPFPILPPDQQDFYCIVAKGDKGVLYNHQGDFILFPPDHLAAAKAFAAKHDGYAETWHNAMIIMENARRKHHYHDN